MKKNNNKLHILLVSILILAAVESTIARQLIAKKIIHAINAGSHMPKRSIEGFVYTRDQGYDEETNAVDYGNDQNVQSQVIKYAKEPTIYMTERHGYSSFSYQLALEKEGVYTVILKFCEMYFDKPGRRVFNIKLGDQRVITNLDVFAKAGKFVAHDEYIEFKYQNGKVYHKNTSCNNAILDGKLIITFEKTQADNPFIQGIIVYAGGLDQTDYEDLAGFKANWEKNYALQSQKKAQQQNKLKESKLKKQEKIILRNDHQDNEGDFEDEEVKEEIKQEQGRSGLSIREILMTPIGILCILGGFFASFAIIFTAFFEDAGDRKTK